MANTHGDKTHVKILILREFTIWFQLTAAQVIFKFTRDCNYTLLFAVVNHKITLKTGNSLGDGTDGDVYVQLVGSSGTTPLERVTSGGEYDDENEQGE